MSNVNLGSTPTIAKLQQYGLILLIVGAVGLVAAYFVGPIERVMADYILGFWYFAGISVTMAFFSALQYLVRAGWSTGVRRIAENFTGFVPFIALALIPIVLNMYSHHSVYEWTHESAKADHILAGKAPYLNMTFFVIRLALYALLWFGMVKFIVGNSVKQDTAGSDITPTNKNWKRAAPFVVVYAVTITFSSFDLLMSLEPHWFSTIWGVYTFAGHFVAAIAVITLMTVALYRAGYLHDYITHEHFHDLGKLMFAFTVFWTYIAFSQYFIIWYANIPEETVYFAFREQGGWQYFGWALMLMHFVVPFMVLLRQDVKRKTTVLCAGAIIILIAHYIDLSWIILPAVSKVISHDTQHPTFLMFGWQEITGWLFFAGAFMFLAARNFKKRAAVAYNDPLIHEAQEYNT
ncbi:MAG: quinol:cytochrome C oxidoreductase [bacterium]|nr:quinol:cytochrome C oxidoreductase [bacterium]